MTAIWDLLQDVLPLGSAVMLIVFIYLLLAYKRLADKVVAIERRGSEVAADQSRYLSERIGAIDSHTTSLERVAASQSKELDRLYAQRDRLLAEMEKSRDGSLVALEEQFNDVACQLRNLIPLGEQTSRIEEQVRALRQDVEVVKRSTQVRYNRMTRLLLDRSEGRDKKADPFRLYWLHTGKIKEDDSWWSPLLNEKLAHESIQVFEAPHSSGARDAFNRKADFMPYCDFVVADLTKPTPFIFYELGRAQAELKPTIIITNSASRVPFNLANIKIFFVQEGRPRKKMFEANFSDTLQQLMDEMESKSFQKTVIDRLHDFVRFSRALWVTVKADSGVGDQQRGSALRSIGNKSQEDIEEDSKEEVEKEVETETDTTTKGNTDRE